MESEPVLKIGTINNRHHRQATRTAQATLGRIRVMSINYYGSVGGGVARDRSPQAWQSHGGGNTKHTRHIGQPHAPELPDSINVPDRPNKPTSSSELPDKVDMAID